MPLAIVAAVTGTVIVPVPPPLPAFDALIAPCSRPPVFGTTAIPARPAKTLASATAPSDTEPCAPALHGEQRLASLIPVPPPPRIAAEAAAPAGESVSFHASVPLTPLVASFPEKVPVPFEPVAFPATV